MSIDLNITLANTRLKIGETTTATFAFSEAVRGFANDDIVLTDANGTLGTLTANADGKTWTATFTPTDDIEDASNTISVNLAGVIDAAGTAGTGTASSTNYSIDTKRPMVNSITIADPKLCADESTTVTITFSEALKQNSFTLDTLFSFSLNGGTFSDLRTTDDITWQLTLTAPTSGTSSTGNYIGLRWHHLIDLADNRGLHGNMHLSQALYDIDLVRPTATITLADSALTVGETTTVTLAFSEPVTGFTIDDIVLTDANGTLGTLTPNANRTVWTATFTPTANVSDTSNTISINLTGLTDDAGNAGVSTATSANYTVDTRPADTTGPTATITLADTALTVGETTTVTIRFNEPVTNFDASDVVLTDANGTLGTLTPNADRTVWTATFTPTANVNDTTNTISVNLTGVTDTAGNAGVSTASSANYTVDTRPADTTGPTATITLADTALTVGETTTVTIRFNEPVTNFDASDIVLTDANGTLGTLTANADGKTWTATFTPTANVNDTTNTISVNLAGLTDTAGNAGVSTATSANYTVDTRPADTTGPTATITLADSALTVGETTTVTIRFNEPVTNFDASDIVLTNANGTLGTLTANTDGKTWTATFTPTANVNDTTNTISVNLAGVTDTAGNAGVSTATSANYTVDTRPADTTGPTATVTLADTALTVGETTTVTIRFNEPVTNFDASDVVLTDANGTLGTLTANADGKTWTATFTPTANVNDTTNTISVNLAGLTDTAGNAGVSTATSANYTVDTLRPTATITLADNALTVGETTTVTFAFSEAVTDFTREDIVLTDANGTLGPLTANADGKTWTATFTPTANVNDTTNTISVNLTGVTDTAGNAGVSTATSANYTVDTLRPTATITLADNALTVGETTTVTFAFSEPVNGFTRDDIVLTDANGTLGTLTANADGKTWTATFTPTANVNDTTNTISVNLAGVTDTAGNAGVSTASSANYSVNTRSADTTGPTATITLADTALTVGETTAVTIRFNEPVNGFTSDDVVLTDANGTLGTLTSNANRTVWTATFTPTANVNDTTNTISVNLTGVTDDAGNAGVSTASSANYTVDTRPADTTGPTATITLADSALTVGETTTVTLAFSEPVTGFTIDDIVLTDANGTLGPLTANADGKTWTATFTPTANVNDTTNTISVNLTGVNDIAGNAGVGTASSSNYTVSTRPANTAGPTVTITLANTRIKADETTTVTFAFSEAVTDFTREDIVLTNANGTLGTLTANADGKTWTVTFTPTDDIEDSSNTIGVNLAGVRDAAGNVGTGSASSANYSIDTKRPIPTSISIDDNKLCTGESTTVTLTFSEALNRDSFTLAHIRSASNAAANPGTLSDLRTTDGITWQFTLTAPTTGASSTGNYLRILGSAVTDVAGNRGWGGVTSFDDVLYDIDLVRPTATITLADSALTVGETTTVTLAFSEPVTGFTIDDIVLTDANGTLGTLTPNANRTVWTATFTPTANVSDTSNTISVNLTGLTDTAGNAGVSTATSDNYTVNTRSADTTGPTATITLADTALTVGETTTVTIRFNEPVTNFDASDIVLTDANGTLGTLTANADGKTWTATFTPTANVN
ncbi:beta strand repeat-containing protein, partial [Verminephrobacter aporrectodeae]